jgi:hypothetical protein
MTLVGVLEVAVRGDGYAGIPGVQYVYTNTAGNCRNAAVGDTVVVRDRELVHRTRVFDALCSATISSGWTCREETVLTCWCRVARMQPT